MALIKFKCAMVGTSALCGVVALGGPKTWQASLPSLWHAFGSCWAPMSKRILYGIELVDRLVVVMLAAAPCRCGAPTSAAAAGTAGNTNVATPVRCRAAAATNKEERLQIVTSVNTNSGDKMGQYFIVGIIIDD